MKSLLKKHVPAFGIKWISSVLHKKFVPPIGKVDLGDFARTEPFSNNFGYSRGGPIDRYYIERFLSDEAGAIKGKVLEIGDNDYTLRFGGNKVSQSEILHS